MPAYTGQQLVNAALTNLAIMDQGGVASVSDSNEALIRLNYMLEQWRIQNKFIWSVGIQTYALVASQKSYVIGPGGADFNTVRPTYIEHALISLAGPNPANPIQRQMRLISAEEYQAHPDKAAAAAIPDELYNDRGSPTSTLYLWPAPRATTTNLLLYTWAQLANYATLATSNDLPDGYAEAISNALAMRLVSMFGVVVSQEVVSACSSLAQQAEASIVELNAKARGMMLAPPAPAKGGK